MFYKVSGKLDKFVCDNYNNVSGESNTDSLVMDSSKNVNKTM